jgi:(S)-ureidoglycine aminohydrolase
MHHLGLTRSANRRDHLLLTPDTFIRTPLPGLTNGMAIVHVAPQAGAAFTMMTVELEPGGGYAYLPTDYPHTLKAASKARAVVIDKPFLALPPAKSEERDQPRPLFLIGREAEVASVPLNGDEALQVRSLLPNSLAFDFACNTMTYAPGAGLSQVEIHYMEHGLLMLEGGGIYRLGDQWYPTQAGDFIWMAPFCPQWFGAIGKQPAKYLIYKDFNRHTLA